MRQEGKTTKIINSFNLICISPRSLRVIASLPAVGRGVFDRGNPSAPACRCAWPHPMAGRVSEVFTDVFP